MPGDEGGQLTALDPEDSAFRVAARGVLFLPKLAIAAALSPVRGALWANDRYRLEDLYYRVFYNADRTIGLFPTAAYTSGFGVAAGAGFVSAPGTRPAGSADMTTIGELISTRQGR